jgi:septal ring factor EnvC (AmiA/AmiB activator)
VLFASFASVSAQAQSAASPSDLDGLRRQAIAAAAAAQNDERTIATLHRNIRLLASDADGRRRGLDESRGEQARLLGALELLRHRPPDHAVFAGAPALARVRGEMLMDATVPALRAEARALGAEIMRIHKLDAEIAARNQDLVAARRALATERALVADLSAKRLAAMRRMFPAGGLSGAETARLARDSGDVSVLIDDADAALARHDKELLRQGKEDPTRPAALRAFDPPQSALVAPVSGAIVRPFGAADPAGKAEQSLAFSGPPGAEIVAPFDGRVVYAGTFRGLGPILIMRHGRRYHSLLVGLGRVDVKSGQWLLAGEPVGAMPDAPPSPTADAGGGASVLLTVELRRDGRPVDPQPWLASRDRDERRDPSNGDQRVR